MNAPRHRVPVECHSQNQLVREFKSNMSRGIAVTTGGEELRVGALCEIVIIHPMSGLMHPLHAVVRAKNSQGRAVCEIDGFDKEVFDDLRDFIGVQETEGIDFQPGDTPSAPESVPAPRDQRRPPPEAETSEQSGSVVAVPNIAAIAVEVDNRGAQRSDPVMMPVAAIKLKQRTSDGRDVLKNPDTNIDGYQKVAEEHDTRSDGMSRSEIILDTQPEIENDGDTIIQPGLDSSMFETRSSSPGPEADIVDIALAPELGQKIPPEPAHRRTARSMETLDMLLPVAQYDGNEEESYSDALPIQQIPLPEPLPNAVPQRELEPEPEDDGDTVIQDVGLQNTAPEASDVGLQNTAPEASRAATTPASEETKDRDGDDEEEDQDDPLLRRTKVPINAHERLRGIPLHEAHKVARSGNINERVALERIYGKSVWEPLLQNPNLTPPEVARIARMRNLPKPLIDSIVSRNAWLTKSLVRRALLSNPRLGGRSLTKVLRALPKAELKLVPQNSAYPYKVRDAANRILGSAGK